MKQRGAPMADSENAQPTMSFSDYVEEQRQIAADTQRQDIADQLAAESK